MSGEKATVSNCALGAENITCCMFIHTGKYLGLDARLAWWPDGAKSIVPLLDQSPVVILWQCPLPLAAELRRFEFRRRPFYTPLIDLAQAEEQLWQRLEPKSCRYEIRKAEKMQCEILINEETEAARKLLNESIRRLQYRGELGEQEWQALLTDHDIFLVKCEGTPIAVHVMMLDRPGRTRLLLSGSVDRGDDRWRKAVGPGNRLLHWRELLHYKQQGFRHYDFGGCDLDKSHPEYSIAQFKLSFGADVVEEPMLYLAKNPVFRLALRTAAVSRNALKRIPWPEHWLHAVRRHPKLASLFR